MGECLRWDVSINRATDRHCRVKSSKAERDSNSSME